MAESSHKKRSAKELTDDLLSSVDLSFSSQAVIPGDDVTGVVTKQSKKIHLGAGLYHDPKLNTIKAVRSGILKYSPPATYWVESKSMKRCKQTNTEYFNIIIHLHLHLHLQQFIIIIILKVFFFIFSHYFKNAYKRRGSSRRLRYRYR
jgi:hypothetical protein